MSYTRHGHHIPGSEKADYQPAQRVRCGFMVTCRSCRDEVNSFHATVHPIPPQTMALHLVMAWVDENSLDTTTEVEIFVVWFTYILGGWKTLIGTSRTDGLYFEITYDKDKKRIYRDVYRKIDHDVIDD